MAGCTQKKRQGEKGEITTREYNRINMNNVEAETARSSPDNKRERVLGAKIAVVYHKGKHSTRKTNSVPTGDIARSGLYHDPGKRTGQDKGKWAGLL